MQQRNKRLTPYPGMDNMSHCGHNAKSRPVQNNLDEDRRSVSVGAPHATLQHHALSGRQIDIALVRGRSFGSASIECFQGLDRDNAGRLPRDREPPFRRDPAIWRSPFLDCLLGDAERSSCLLDGLPIQVCMCHVG